MASRAFLSKSKYLAGLQCQKLLWHHYNAKDEIPPPDDATQAVFDQGHAVGALAQSLFPGGIEIAGDPKDIALALRLTQERLAERKPLFEPAFQHKSAFARADILNPVGKSQWDIIEVKSSTSVKEVNLFDLALQRYAYKGAGLDIRRCILMHINSAYVREGTVDPRGLFLQADVTPEVAALLPRIEADLAAMTEVIARKMSPDTPIGAHCTSPYGCALMEKCWKFLPEDNPTTLYRLRKEKAFELIGRGVTSITKLPRDVALNDKQRIQVGSAQKKTPFVDAKYIRQFLAQLAYPLYYLDFETVGSAVPLFDASKPFEQIPFQFSLHVQDAPGAAARHDGYLAEGRGDPRKEFLERLRELLGDAGTIVVYNEAFELGRLDELTTLYPARRGWYGRVKRRTLDLLRPFRDFAYYHPDQHGSASIKAVLPALTGTGYDGMAIGDGGTASAEFLRVTFGDADEADRAAVREALKAYCALDTLAMLRIVDKLRALVR